MLCAWAFFSVTELNMLGSGALRPTAISSVAALHCSTALLKSASEVFDLDSKIRKQTPSSVTLLGGYCNSALTPVCHPLNIHSYECTLRFPVPADVCMPRSGVLFSGGDSGLLIHKGNVYMLTALYYLSISISIYLIQTSVFLLSYFVCQFNQSALDHIVIGNDYHYSVTIAGLA